MKVDFNTTQPSTTPNFKKLTIDKKAMNSIKTQYCAITEPVLKEGFLNNLKTSLKILNESPLKSNLKVRERDPQKWQELELIVLDSIEENLFEPLPPRSFRQFCSGWTEFLLSAASYVKSLHKDNTDLVKVFKENTSKDVQG